jgi:hypothetical protein
VSVAIVIFFYGFRYFINYWKYWFPCLHAPTFMRTLSIKVRNWCTPWPYAAVPYTHAQHAHKFCHFSNVHFVYHQHTCKDWCVHWAYTSGTNACTQHSPFKTCWAYASGTDAYPEHTGQELMHSLSIRVRNWCIPWAYISVSYSYAQHKLQRSLQNMLSMGVRNWWMHWGCASGTDVCTDRTRQEQMCMLSLHISN